VIMSGIMKPVTSVAMVACGKKDMLLNWGTYPKTPLSVPAHSAVPTKASHSLQDNLVPVRLICFILSGAPLTDTAALWYMCACQKMTGLTWSIAVYRLVRRCWF
jgi:hypothetical protein